MPPKTGLWGLVRDIWIVAIASFILIYETVEIPTPSELLVGAALVLLGLPAAIRLDERKGPRRK